MREQHSTQTEQTEPTIHKKKRKPLKCFLYGISAVIFLVVLMVVGLVSVLGSEQRTQQLLRFAQEQIAGLQINHSRGDLQQGLLLENLQFHSQYLHADFPFMYVKVDFACLWRAEICLEDLTLKNASLQIDTTSLPSNEEKESSSGLTPVFLPLSVAVKNILIENVEMNIDHHHFRLSHFHTAFNLNNKQGLTLFPTEINGMSFLSDLTEEQLKKQKVLVDKSENKASLPVDWKLVEKNLTTPLFARLQKITLPFALNIQNLQGKDWQYQQILWHSAKQDGKKINAEKSLLQDIQIPIVQIQANVNNHIVEIEHLDIQSNLGEIQGSGKAKLDGDFPLDFSFKGGLSDIKEEGQLVLARTEGALSVSGNLKKQTALLLQTQGGIEGELSIQAELNREKTPIKLLLQSPQAAYAFVLGNPLKTKNVRLAAQGNLMDYQAHLTGDAEGMHIPPSSVDLSGVGGINQARLDKLQINGLRGQLNLQGDLNWADGFKWQTNANLDQLHAGDYFKHWPAVLSGDVQFQGNANRQGWLIELPQLSIQGQVSQRNFSVKGDAATGSKYWFSTSGLSLNYGENQLDTQGFIGDNSGDFKLNINAPTIAGLVPDLQGGVKGHLSFNGDLYQFDFVSDLNAQNLSFGAFQLAKGSIQGQITEKQQIQGELKAELSGFKIGEMNLQNAVLQIKGNEQDHQLSLSSQGSPVATSFNLSGNFDRTLQHWKGELSEIAVKTPQGHIGTDKKLQITYDHNQLQAEVNPHCWKHSYAELCLNEPVSVGKLGNILFQLKRFDVAFINQLSGQENLLKGLLSGKGKVNWSQTQPIQAQTEFEGKQLVLSPKIGHRNFHLVLADLQVKADLEDNNLKTDTKIQLAQQGLIKAELNIQDIVQQRKLSGGLNIQQLDLDLLSQLLSRNEKISGEISSALTFAGDLNRPLLNGQLQVRNIGTQLKTLPFNLEQSELALQFYGERSTLSGQLKSAAGSLLLKGEASWQGFSQWKAGLQAEARNFLVELPSFGKLKVSPNLNLKADGNVLALSGDVHIPWARLEIDELPPSAVEVSKDEVILERKSERKNTALSMPVPAETTSGMQIKSDIKIQLGDDVKVSAYGLKSDLNGLLSLKQEKGKLGLYGQINLKNGRYRAYGQDLLVRKGEVYFSGLAEQAMLNIEAVRNPESMENTAVTAGLKVSGVATSPEINVFSTPALSQDEALSYLLTGRSLEKSGEAGSSGSVGAALLGLGLGKSGSVVSNIGQAFGIQDLNLDTAGVGEKSKVEVSGSISPRLKVKYGIGLFDGLAEVTVRYRLLPQLYLQSVSGVNQAFDLLYQFEF